MRIPAMKLLPCVGFVLLAVSYAFAAPPPDPLKPDYGVAPMQDWEKKFSSFAFNAYQDDGHVLPYRLHSPDPIEKGKKYPLVVFFHGAGERGIDNRVQFLRAGAMFEFWNKYPCYVLAPLCPLPEQGVPGVWVDTAFGGKGHRMKDEPAWPLRLAMDVIDKVVAENPVDPKRVYVTGLSMGGFATWELLARQGDRIAAAMPICGGGDAAYAADMAKIPIWVFHGDADEMVMVDRSREMIEALKAAGGNPKYSEYPGATHDVWSRTYADPAVWEWLFEQKAK